MRFVFLPANLRVKCLFVHVIWEVCLLFLCKSGRFERLVVGDWKCCWLMPIKPHVSLFCLRLCCFSCPYEAAYRFDWVVGYAWWLENYVVECVGLNATLRGERESTLYLAHRTPALSPPTYAIKSYQTLVDLVSFAQRMVFIREWLRMRNMGNLVLLSKNLSTPSPISLVEVPRVPLTESGDGNWQFKSW